MAIYIDAIYEDGVLRPQNPIDLPNSTPVHVTIVPQAEFVRAEGELGEDDDEDETLANGPYITVEEFRRIMRECTFRAGSLPVDFDRDDIYSDHD